jgi:hypothetical protein
VKAKDNCTGHGLLFLFVPMVVICIVNYIVNNYSTSLKSVYATFDVSILKTSKNIHFKNVLRIGTVSASSKVSAYIIHIT